MEQRKRDLKTMRQDHQLLAMKVLFTEEQVALFQNKNQNTFSVEQLTRIGIVQVSYDGKPYFIHRTFAEYYVADFLVNRLTEGNDNSQNVKDIILKDIFLEAEYRVIRVFTDGLFSRTNLSKVVLKQFGNQIHDFEKDGVLILHTAAREGNAKIIRFLLNSLQEAEHTDTVKNLLLAKDGEGLTAWHQAVLWSNIEVLEKLWNWNESNLIADELKGKLLLAADKFGRTVCHMAAAKGNLDIWQKVWHWAEKKLTTEEKNELLIATDRNGRNALHVAAYEGNLNILLKLWEWAQEILTKEEIIKCY
jgi:hypothetical protein